MENFNRRFIYFICIVSAMDGLLFGYDWVVIGGAKPFYEVFFGIANEPTLQGLAMSIALAGCLVGAMVCGTLADRLGYVFFKFRCPETKGKSLEQLENELVDNKL